MKQTLMELTETDIRYEFPVLRNHPDIVYLDSGATTQKPESVIRRIDRYYRQENANVHRGIHSLSEAATEAYEGARGKVQKFLKAKKREEVIFTGGTTDAINLVASVFRESLLGPGKRILLTEMEHHANLVPWQLAAERSGAELDFIPLADDGSLDLNRLDEKLNPDVAVLALTQVSNVLGAINPVEEIIGRAHEAGIPVLVDAAQSIPRLPVDVQALGADFLVFSGHKVYGPTGIGVLYGREEWLERLPPWRGGGDMIDTVELEKSTWNTLPCKFEAGTPNIAGAAGLGAALEWLERRDARLIAEKEEYLTEYLRSRLEELSWIKMLPAPEGARTGLVSFTMDGIHPYDAAQILDRKGFALRSGHHCAQPLHRRFGLEGSLRASFGVYNRESELDRLVEALQDTRRFLA
ncbi:SufS family cysteine desulfurase [Marispirochaeta aestuarii]|uniref:aminotransferase class V-fold PLP-dependent enzyme n=1 Tax=Marispirochaeta aestuarii TaxID=1963862 RepID=UPI002ABE9388|nr:SufS family cysteine desulfurase [Marispirochaeta aestuarii]